MLVEVTQEDIETAEEKRERGKRLLERGEILEGNREYNNTKHCPIANALKRATGDEKVWVGIPSWGTDSRTGFFVYLPVEALNFIDGFDKGLPVGPFSFETEDLP